MQRERLLAGGVAALIVAMLLTAALVPGILSQPTEDDLRPTSLDLRKDDSSIRTLSVPGDTARLQLDARLAHRGAPAENVSVEVQARDADTGLLADGSVRSVGSVGGGQTVSIPIDVTVPREGYYDLRIIVYENGSRVTTAEWEVGDVGSLTPDYARSSVTFQQFDSSGGNFGSLSTAVRSVDGDRVTLNVTANLLNEGSERSDEVRVHLRARQAESNVVAAERTATVGSIAAGNTVRADAGLTVPDQYNYWIDAILVSDGVVVGTSTAPANLLPEERLDEPDNDSEDELAIEDFAEDTETPRDDSGFDDDGSTPEAGPGFGSVVALVAIVAAALLAVRRRSQ